MIWDTATDQHSLIYWSPDQCVTAALCVCVDQANVYHASTSAGENRAIKIYKTSILLFKDRDKYVSGEFRWAAHHRRRVYQSQICSVQILLLSSGATNWVGLILWRFTEPRSSVTLLLLLCRFRHGYCKGNPRKMVRTWAEKEMRNLIRSEDRTQQNLV